MSEFMHNTSAESGPSANNDGPWGEDYQKSVPPFNPDQKNNIEYKREHLGEMPLNTNEQQADYLDAFMEISYADSYQTGDENFDKSEIYPTSQKALLGREMISELRGQLKDPNNIGKTFYDLLKDRLQQIEQVQNDFQVTGPNDTWTKEDDIARQLLFEQREISLYMADLLKTESLKTESLSKEEVLVSDQENFKESYCLKKRELKKNRLQNIINKNKGAIEEVSNDQKLSEYAKEKRIRELKSEIEDAHYEMDDAELENDILKDAMHRRSGEQTTGEVLQKDAAVAERTIEYYKGLIDSAKAETAKVGFRRSYKEAKNKLRRINAVISDLEEAKNRNIRLG